MLKIRQTHYSVLNLDLREDSTEVTEATAHFYLAVTSAHTLVERFSAQRW